MKPSLLLGLSALVLAIGVLASMLLFSNARRGESRAQQARSIGAPERDARESSRGGDLRVPAPEPADGDRIAPVEAAPTEVVPVVELTREQLWEEEYRDKTATELEAAVHALGEVINKGSYDEMARRLDVGLADYLGPGQAITPSKEDTEKIHLFAQRPDGVYRVILPENEFPELYELKAKQNWLQAEFIERRNRESVAAWNAAQDSKPR